MLSEAQREPIAIIGIGCRFPGAPNPQEFWRILRDGIDAVGEFPKNRWDMDAFYDPDLAIPGRINSRRGGFIDAMDQFDWRAFRIAPREAKYMDPQHRLLLEIAWEALEDAGLPFEKVAGSPTGVFVAMIWNDYLRLLSKNLSDLNGYSASGNGFAFGPNRISYFFDFRGPSVAVDSACAGSLAAVHFACQSIWSGEIDLALAGGVNLMLSPDITIMLSKAGLLSAEGRCKTLDVQADGFVRGEGAGIVVLKPLSKVKSSDHIYALIRGTAINHNGNNEWIMAASARGQKDVLLDAYRKANVDPAEVDYIELHGTGFLKGDASEAQAVGEVIGSQAKRDLPCRIGSVKTNIGHLDSAAGIAGLIKVALSIFNQQIPPTLHLNEVNPAIPLEELGLAAQRDLTPWPNTERPARGGVSSISMSGVNAHVVLEAPSQDDEDRSHAPPPKTRDVQLIPLSARSQEGLLALAERFKNFLADDKGGAQLSLHDICYSASVRRSHHEHRLAIVGHSRQALVEGLEAFLSGQPHAGIFSSQQAEDDSVPILFNGSDPVLSEAISEYLQRVDQTGKVHPSLTCGKEAQILMLQALGALYVKGYTVAWDSLYPDEGQHVQLPIYPWQRERLWPDWLNNAEITQFSKGGHAESRSDKLVCHPLLGRHMELASPEGTHVWEVECDEQFLSSLDKHPIREGMRFLEAAYQELVLIAAANVLGPGPYILKDISVDEEFIVSKNMPKHLQLFLKSRGVGQASYQIFGLSEFEDGSSRSWKLHATGKVGFRQGDCTIQPSSEQPVEQLELLLGLESLAPNERWELLLSYILNQVVKVLGLDSSSSPKPQDRLFEIGLNSLGAVELMTQLGISLGKFLSPTLIFDYPTVEALAVYLAEELLPDLGLEIAVRGITKSVSDNIGSFTSEHEDTNLAQLAEYSEEETEALLIKKLEGIEENL